MKLVEKKCPNCGGELKFSVNDKETKCDYCGKAYEIERENDDKEELFNADNYRITLSEEQKKKVAQAALFGFAAVQIAPIIMFVAFIVIVIIGGVMFSTMHDRVSRTVPSAKIEETVKKKDENLIVDFDKLSEQDLAEIHSSTVNTLNKSVDRHSSFLYKHGNYEFVGMYLLVSEDGNELFDVYKMSFTDSDKTTDFFGAVRYANVKKIDDKLVVDLDGREFNPYVSKAMYGYLGYESCQDLFNKNIRGKLDKSVLKVSGDVYNN